MPQVLSHCPPWLEKPAPGYDLFAAATTSNSSQPSKAGPRRTIARRKEEIFVAVGNQVRWADLDILQHQWHHEKSQREQRSSSRDHGRYPYRDVRAADGAHEQDELGRYRLLKVPVWEDIRQLVISPNEDLIAILTSHTVHVCVLPDPAHLLEAERGPIRLKAFTVGSTTHVLTQSPLASAVWHPLGLAGHCLVTTTAEAIVRVWEFDLENRWSFDSPRLAIDLKRLANGLPQEQNPAPNSLYSTKIFSPDLIEMEVATTCFGGSPSRLQDPWAPMTLWIAMREGDVYALCPLLPSRWTAPAWLVPSLSTGIASKAATIASDPSAARSERALSQRQHNWITDIEEEKLVRRAPRGRRDAGDVVYHRPEQQGPIPRLQGPLALENLPEEDDANAESLLTDIWSIAAKLDPEQQAVAKKVGFRLRPRETEALSWGIICLMTSTGRAHVLLDIDGVQGEWPSEDEKNDSDDESSLYDDNEDNDGKAEKCLVSFQSIDTAQAGRLSGPESAWPLFSADPHSAYSIFVTHEGGIIYLSFSPWAERIEQEASANARAGSELRLETVLKSNTTATQRLLDRTGEDDEAGNDERLAASVLFGRVGLGNLLLTASRNRPFVQVLDYAEAAVLPDTPSRALHELGSHARETALRKHRDPYKVAPDLLTELPLDAFVRSQQQGSNRGAFTEKMEISHATASMLTDTHRMVSMHTHSVGMAAAELFRQCERMLSEFRDQIRSIKELTFRVESVVDAAAEDGSSGQDVRPKSGGEEGAKRRLEQARSRHADLTTRYDALQKKEALLSEHVVSEREEAWRDELYQLKYNVLGPAEDEQVDDGDVEDDSTIQQRFDEVKSLTESLVSETARPGGEDQEAGRGSKGGASASARSGNSRRGRDDADRDIRLSSALRKKKIGQVMGLLDREDILVEATKKRLERLSLA